MSIKSTGEMMLAFAVGGMLGAGLGILFAPSSGKETRKKLVGFEEDLVARAKDIVEEGKEKVVQQKHRLEEAVQSGVKSYNRNQ
jgi:gas vesicle protein